MIGKKRRKRCENWGSKKDLDEHLEMPYLRAFKEKADQILAQTP